MPALPDDQVSERLASLQDWAREGDEIVKTYEAPSFPDAIEFVNRVAALAEAADHHPDLDIRYRKVRVALSTHSEGGITDKDFALAGQIEAAVVGAAGVVTAIVAGAILALCVALVVAIARDRGPGAADTAVAYELAWDRLDFGVVWSLSARELRDGLDRHEFVAAKRAAYEQQRALSGLAEHVGIDDVATTSRGDNALVTTRVELRDGTVVHNVVQLARRSSRWQVVAYHLAPSSS